MTLVIAWLLVSLYVALALVGVALILAPVVPE